jgi:hypothetical protein
MLIVAGRSFLVLDGVEPTCRARRCCSDDDREAGICSGRQVYHWSSNVHSIEAYDHFADIDQILLPVL